MRSILALFVAGAFLAPAGDDFADATPIDPLPFEVTGDSSEATRADDDPSCTFSGDDHTVWYRFTPESDVEILADTFGSSFDTVLSTWTGTRGDLTEVACNDDSGGTLQSRILFTARAGTTYHLMLGSFPGRDGGPYTLRFAQAPPKLQAAVSFDRASVDRNGVATVHATLTCSRAAGTITIVGTLRQGRAVGNYRAEALCDGTQTWSFTVTGETGRFRRGGADALAASEFEDPVRQETVRLRATDTVRLR